MTRIRSFNEIVLSFLDYYKVAQPLLSTNVGSVTRDLVIDGPSAQFAKLYEELSAVSSFQSMAFSSGIALDRWASNIGAVRNRGSKSNGIVVMSFNSLDSDFPINKGDIVTGKNGATFTVINSQTISVVNSSTYKATATKYRADLDFNNITDQYAVEVAVESTTTGLQGNISKYSIASTTIAGIANVINAKPFSGGKSSEDDASFRGRILAIFSGANTGTETGYRNAVLADEDVIDAIVISPGDTLMTRDGTQVSIASDGTRTITSDGTGGKVDILVFGSRLQEVIDSFIYRDKSNTNDPTNTDNDYVLGQIAADVNKTVSRKRIDNLAAGVLPSQPVNNIISVSGSISGNNFIPKDVDSLGRITGNYELVKDDGAYGGSPWGFDRIRWIDSKIRDYPEDKTKLSFNSQDPLSFPDVTEVTEITQNISVTNENSRVSSSDRSSIQLSHYPITSVTRVFNVTTGERYVITSQNPDGSGSLNETGRIVISGKSLPAVSDTLQVDYVWVHTYDPYFDYDNRIGNSNPRTVTDSIDWGFSNAVRREQAILTASGSFLTATVTHPINSVISVNVFTEETATVELSTDSLVIAVSDTVENVVSVIRNSDGSELWNTNKLDGTFNGMTIYLPTDSPADLNDSVSVVYNTTDVYNADTQGSFNDTVITIVPSDTATGGTVVECNYLANISTILPSTLLPALPAIRSGNAFDTSSASGVGCQPTTHLFSGSVIVQNLRQAPSNLGLTIAGSISPGIITVSGTTMDSVLDVVFTSSRNGLTLDLSAAIKSYLGLSSKDSIPSTIRVARLAKLEKVTVSDSLEVLSVSHEYDILGYKLFDNSYVKSEAVADSDLTVTEITLPDTEGNNDNLIEVGDRLRVRFYITTSSDSENISFSKSGTLFTNKRFAIIDTVAISSGFTSGSSQLASLTIANMNQPATRTRYRGFYDYIAPKTNERITVRFNHDRIITDATLAVENTRPITSDVLVKTTQPILVDVELTIVVTDEFKNNPQIVRQNVSDIVTSTLNANQLGTVIDQSDLIDAAYTVSGVDRIRVIYFNKEGEAGSVLSIQAQKNQYLVANEVTINSESR